LQLFQYLSIRETNDTVLHIPDELNPDEFGIVLALHGLGDNYPDNFQRATRFDPLADETKEFVVLYPLGSTCIGSEGI
jgi:poly(3-hydroxybutyrate) depolymerase